MLSVIFVLDHKLHDYRVPLFDELSGSYEVTVVHRGPFIEGDILFSQVVLDYKKIGPYEYIKDLKLDGFDVAVFMQNLRVLNIYINAFLSKAAVVKFWGIGTSSAAGLGEEYFVLRFARNLLTLMSDGLALYSDFPLYNYWAVNRKKIMVVGNSVKSIGASELCLERDYILFIGTLNKRKGLEELVQSFSRVLAGGRDYQLVIVGDGPERGSIERLVCSLGIEKNVSILGAVTNPAEKKEIFARALCVVSPLQAGLSVVESFSFGVPFVTSKHAITGGESLSIRHDENGVLFESIAELDDIILSFFDGRRNSIEMGGRAYDYYLRQLSFELYVERFDKFLKA